MLIHGLHAAIVQRECFYDFGIVLFPSGKIQFFENGSKHVVVELQGDCVLVCLDQRNVEVPQNHRKSGNRLSGKPILAAACIKPPLLESQKQRLFLLGITEKYRKQDMSSFVISSQCNNCMAYQAKYKRKTATAK